MKKLILITVLTISIALLGTGCSKDSGTPPVLSVDGIDITLGQSRPYDLTSQGFETSFSGKYLAIGELPARSWLSMPMVVSKDDQNYAYVNIYNPDKESKLYGLSTIHEMEFSMHSEDNQYWTENNILVNGINFFGMDSASVKEQMTGYKPPRETEYDSIIYDDGDYHYIFSFHKETGILEKINVEMDIAKSYDVVK